MCGDEGERESVGVRRERRQMEQSDCFNSLKAPLEEREKERRKTGKGKTDSRKAERQQVCGAWSPSVLLTVLGLKGGGISSLSRRSQSIQRKNGCSLISRSASTPPPRRLAGCFVRSLDTSGEWEKDEEKTIMSNLARLKTGQTSFSI